MGKLYKVSIINKHDLWLQTDEENPANWMVMQKYQLEQYLQRGMGTKEEIKGRAIIGYDDIVWKKLL